MLFGYPIEAIENNWFHECMIEILATMHSKARSGEKVPSWPEIIPERYRENLSRRNGLRDRLILYQKALIDLPDADIDRISNAINSQNKIAQLLAGMCNCETIDELPETIRQPARNLFEFGFELLTDLKIRDHQYEMIYERMPYHVCPFCGCEYFDAPGAPRESLDHFLAESIYPFAAANLYNLVPMGNKCNSKYKLAQDILYDVKGNRRHSYYPYSNLEGIRISLIRSEPFAGTESLFPLPDWNVEFEPQTEEVSTWNTVFHIEERLKRDILDADFISWLREFSGWCRSINLRPVSEKDVVDALNRYTNYMQDIGIRDRAFLKAAVFQMLCFQYQQGNQRVKTLVDGVVIGGMA